MDLEVTLKDKIEISKWMLGIGVVPPILQEAIYYCGTELHDSVQDCDSEIDLVNRKIKYVIWLPFFSYWFTKLVIKWNNKGFLYLLLLKLISILFRVKGVIHLNKTRNKIFNFTGTDFLIDVELKVFNSKRQPKLHL